MQTQPKQGLYTAEEYLLLEENAECRSEYRNGEILPMTGGSINHNEIVGNLLANLRFLLRGQNYRVFASDLRVWIPSQRIYTYPDVLAIAGEPALHENRKDTVTNPLLIFEVLSKSTSAYDKGEKFDYYRSIPGFSEYILIDQYKFHVKQFAKTSDQKWLLTDYESGEDVLRFSTLDAQISLAEIYAQVEF